MRQTGFAISRRLALLGAGGAVAASLLPDSAAAQSNQTTVIDVTRARTDPIPIAVPDMAGASGDAQRFGRDIAA
jgi:TolB protein